MAIDRAAAYRLAGWVVEVWSGDATGLPADAAVFGHDPALRDRLERVAGRPFEPAGETTGGRRFDALGVGKPPVSPWRVALSVDDRPGATSDGQEAEGRSPVDRLRDDLAEVVAEAMRRSGPGATVVLHPVGCLGPEDRAVAAVLAAWSTIVSNASAAGDRRPGRFRLVDPGDPTPYIRALEDRDGITTRALSASSPGDAGPIDRWARHRFEPA